MRKKVITLLATSTIITAIIVPVITYYTIVQTTKSQFENNKSKKSLDEIKKNLTLPKYNVARNIIQINQKIKYLALGDSIPGAYTMFTPEDLPGKFNEITRKFENGASFPTYLAYFFEKMEPNRLESYHNLGVSSSTIGDWLKLLNWSYLPTQGFLAPNDHQEKLFGDNKKQAEYKQKMLDYIKKANLISVTLGANDFFELFGILIKNEKYSNILKDFQNDKAARLVKLLNLMKEIVEEINNRYQTFVNNVKKLNPKANIFLTSYPMPLNRLTKVFDSLILGLNGLSTSLMDILNNQITKYVANLTNVSYLNLYDEEYWTENQEKLTQTLFDIHPTLFGWKKMAMDAFLKLTTGYTSIESYKQFDFHWTDSYIKSDESLKMVDTTLDLYDLKQKIFGSKTYENYLYDLADDPIYKNIKDKYGRDQIKNRGLDYVLNSILDFVLKNPKELEFFKQLDNINGDLIRLLEGKTNNKPNTELIKDLLNNSKYFYALILEMQRYFMDEDFDKDGKPGGKFITKEIFIDRVFKTLLNSQIFHKNVLLPFLKSDLFTKNKDKWIKVFELILAKYNDDSSKFIYNLVDIYFDYVYAESDHKMSKEDAKTYLLKLFKNKNINQIFIKITKYVLEHPTDPLILNANSFLEAIKSIIESNPVFKVEIVKEFNNLFEGLAKDEKFIKLLALRINKFKLKHPKVITDPDNIWGNSASYANAHTNLKKIISYFNEDPTLKNKFIEKVINSIFSFNKDALIFEKMIQNLNIKELLSQDQYNNLAKN